MGDRSELLPDPPAGVCGAGSSRAEARDKLQTLTEVASERNSTIVFPLPLELLGPFLKGGRDGASALVDGRPEDASPGVKDPAQSEKVAGVGATPVMASGNGR